MYEVSTNYEMLAEAPGRHVYCKIVAGSTTFYDDKIIKFEFDDIAYPEYYTIGTASSSRFSFSVRYTGELQVHDKVQPYISFDNEEWCPLGTFFVSRRYVRGAYASITCYDMMYSLNEEYIPSIQAPTTAAMIYHDICSQFNIPCESGDWMTSHVMKLPKGFTAREVLGFLASCAGSIAKFTREGKLLIRKLGALYNRSYLDESNCMDINRNINESTVRGIRFDTGDDELMYGEDTKLTCLDVYNPIIAPDVAEAVYHVQKNFKFYGAEIKMQGLPYMEAGDNVLFVHSVPGQKIREIVNLVACEIVFNYDGQFTATLYSRPKTDSDTNVHKEDLKNAINDVRKELGNVCQSVINKEDIEIDSAYATVAAFEFETAAKRTFAQVDLNFTVYTEAASTLAVRVMVNGTEMTRQAIHKTAGGRRELVHYYCLVEKLAKGKNVITLLLSSNGSQAKILANQLQATMIGKGTEGGDSGNYRDRLSFFESIPIIAANIKPIKIAGFDTTYNTETE